MISTNKSATSNSKNNHKKSGGSKSKKHAKSNSSENQDDSKSNESSEGRCAVFKADTIECFAEQYMNADDLPLAPEFCSRLADDVTYKLYELIHNVKTFAHPIGGVVTTDVVNDVLKVADVPPILGPPKPLYEDIGYEEDVEPHFFVHDSILDVLDEIQSDILIKQTGALGMKVGYYLTEKDTAIVQTFYTKVCRALLSGSNSSLKDCLQILRVVEQFEPVLPNLLTLCTLVLKDYHQILINATKEQNVSESKVMYERALLILLALSKNRTIRTATVYNELHHIVQMLIQILFLFTNISIKDSHSNNVDIKSTNIFKNVKIEIKEHVKMEIDETKKFDADGQTDISIIDENNSSLVMNLNDIIECKNVFDNHTGNQISNISKTVPCNTEDIEKICNVLVAIGENWLCIRGKVIETLLPNLSCDDGDPQNVQNMKLLAIATSKLLYNFDIETYFELDYWMYEFYGESIILNRPVKHATALDLQI